MTAQAKPWPLLRALTESLLRASPDLSTRLADTIRAEVPLYRGASPVSAAALQASCDAHVDYLCGDWTGEGAGEGTGEATGEGISPDGRDRDSVPRSIGVARAREEIGLPDVLDAFRVGSQFLWRELVGHARSSRTVSDADLVSIASEVWLMNDTFVRLMQQGYRSEHTAMLLTRQRERFGLVYAVLTSRDLRNATLWEAVDRIGLPRSGGFVAVAATVMSTGRLPLPTIEADLAGRHIVSAWILLSDVQLGIVSTTVARAAGVLVEAMRQAGATAGVSPRYDNYALAAQAARLARTALAASRPGQVIAFADSPIGMAAAGSPDVSWHVATGVLGEVLGLPEQERMTLLSTVQAWFDAGGSVAVAAGRLYVHPNTVRNRLRRVETLTGRALANPREAAEIYLALAGISQRQEGTDAGSAAPG